MGWGIELNRWQTEVRGEYRRYEGRRRMENQ
jgi:hypothetical protein